MEVLSSAKPSQSRCSAVRHGGVLHGVRRRRPGRCARAPGSLGERTPAKWMTMAMKSNETKLAPRIASIAPPSRGLFLPPWGLLDGFFFACFFLVACFCLACFFLLFLPSHCTWRRGTTGLGTQGLQTSPSGPWLAQPEGRQPYRSAPSPRTRATCRRLSPERDIFSATFSSRETKGQHLLYEKVKLQAG